MPRGVFNWTFKDVTNFLRDHNFEITHVEESHYFYRGFTGGAPRIVQVPFHGAKSLKPRTLQSIIRQSGIDKKKWLA